MPIRLGLCASHAPSLFYSTVTGWERMHHILNDGHPQPPETELEKPALIIQRISQIRENFASLRTQLESYAPDSIIVVMGDQREWFDESNIPNIAVYTGNDLWGFHCTGAMDENPPANPGKDPRFRIEVPTDQPLARELLHGLVKEGFDVANIGEMNPLGPQGNGVPHGWSNVAPHLQPKSDNPIPVVLVYVNVDDGPPVILNGQRCLDLGSAIAKICEGSEKRIAIFGSGGMSHDPRGPRSGWVDEPLDNWFMDQITNGTTDNMKALFSFRSENLVSGTGELRCWMIVAGAIREVKPGHRGINVGYIPARKVTTGAGWAYWPIVDDTVLA